MKIVIDLELSSAQKRIIRAAVVLGAVAGALGVGVAIAAPKSFSVAMPGEYAGLWTVNFKTGVPVAGTSQNGIQLCTNQFPIACCD
jgi:hypothetical protein